MVEYGAHYGNRNSFGVLHTKKIPTSFGLRCHNQLLGAHSKKKMESLAYPSPWARNSLAGASMVTCSQWLQLHIIAALGFLAFLVSSSDSAARRVHGVGGARIRDSNTPQCCERCTQYGPGSVLLDAAMSARRDLIHGRYHHVS